MNAFKIGIVSFQYHRRVFYVHSGKRIRDILCDPYSGPGDSSRTAERRILAKNQYGVAHVVTVEFQTSVDDDRRGVGNILFSLFE